MVLSAFGPAKQCLSTAAAIYLHWQVRSIAERAIQIISTASQVFGWVMNLPYDGSDLGTRMAKSIPTLLGIITRIILSRAIREACFRCGLVRGLRVVTTVCFREVRY